MYDISSQVAVKRTGDKKLTQYIAISYSYE